MACFSLAVWVVHLAQSLTLSFLKLLLLWSAVSAARQALSLSALTLVFLFLRWFGSFSRIVLGIHVQVERALESCLYVIVYDISPTQISVCNVKSVSTWIYRTTYARYIYEKSTVQLASVGLAQARPNKWETALKCKSSFRDGILQWLSKLGWNHKFLYNLYILCHFPTISGRLRRP